MTKKGGFWWTAGAVTVAASVALLFFDGDDLPLQEAPRTTAAVEHRQADTTLQAAPTVVQLPSASRETTGSAEKVNDEEGPTFRTDAAGSLIVDEHMRIGIEGLLALNEPGNLPAAIAEQTKNLSREAARKAEELVDRFHHYSEAQRESYPPGVALPTEEDALAQLDGLHSLRESHFGPEIATAFYGNEEKLSRELIELMRLEKDKSLTMSEKADRAQALHDRLPTVAAIEKNNRAPSTTEKRSAASEAD